MTDEHIFAVMKANTALRSCIQQLEADCAVKDAALKEFYAVGESLKWPSLVALHKSRFEFHKAAISTNPGQHLLDRMERMKGAFRLIEFSLVDRDNDKPKCPLCHRYKEDILVYGHNSNCTIGQTLAEIEGGKK